MVLRPLDLETALGREVLLEWCESHPPARYWVARSCHPLRPPSDGEFPSWTPLAVALLDAYGSDADVRGEMSARIFSGTWGGSTVPRLKTHRGAYAELAYHANEDVRRWAADNVHALDVRIRAETSRDEERDFGILW